MALSSEGRIARRPALFRALGPGGEPLRVSAHGREYALVETLKHDSWAATARYRSAGGDDIVCKFGRRTPLLIFPGAWIGRRLARREARVLRTFGDGSVIPRIVEPVFVEGAARDDVVAHEWIAGATFTPWSRVDDEFFPRLRDALARLHAAGVAHADLAKWENIVVGDDGRPWLLDFQIHLEARNGGWQRFFVRQMQGADRFYLQRHWMRARPDQRAMSRDAGRMPLFVRVGEAAGSLWRPIRTLVLRCFGVEDDRRRANRPSPPADV
jgi:hypothetical protein